MVRRFLAQADELHRQGVLAGLQGCFDAAVDLLTRATLLAPTNAVAHCDLARALKGLHRLEAALRSYDRSIALDPRIALAHNNRGNVLRDLTRPIEALASYDAALAVEPGYADAHFNRGVLLGNAERWVDALASYERAIELRRNHADAFCNRGVVLERLGRWPDALESYDRAIEAAPGLAAAHCNRGNVLRELRRLEPAVDSCDRAIALRQDFPDAHFNRAVALAGLRRLEEALQSYDRCIAFDPPHVGARFGRATALLLLGRLAAGFLEFEWRWAYQRARFGREPRPFAEPLWLGKESLRGKAILLYSEQGLGDTIQFCRFARPVAQLGATVILQVPQRLASTLADLDGVSALIANDSPAPAFDYQCPLMSLPLAIQTTCGTIPADIPYLTAPTDQAAAWRERLGAWRRLRVGVAWRGNAQHPDDRNRSLSLDDLAAHLPDGCDYVSLQLGTSDRERETLRAMTPLDVESALLRDFSDTAALCACLDLIVTVDTSIAHLGGALGKPTWILLPYLPDWRWGLHGARSPWYPTVRLYRQPQPGDWTSALRRLSSDLSAARATKTATPQ